MAFFQSTIGNYLVFSAKEKSSRSLDASMARPQKYSHMYLEARGVFSRPGHLDEDEKEGRDHSKARGKRIKKIIKDKKK